MREIMLVPQGHPYSNDDDEPMESPRWFYWLVIILIGVGIGVWLKNNAGKGK